MSQLSLRLIRERMRATRLRLMIVTLAALVALVPRLLAFAVVGHTQTGSTRAEVITLGGTNVAKMRVVQAGVARER